MLGTTPTTLFEKGDVTVPLGKIKEPELLANAEKSISLSEFKFVDKLTAVITESHAPSNDFLPFRKLRCGGR